MTENLDCTIRDGGYTNNWNFDEDEVVQCYESVSKAGYDYFEIGFFSRLKKDNHGRWRSCSEYDSKWLLDIVSGCKLSAMFSLEDNRELKIEESNKTNINLARVHARINSDQFKEINESYVLCKKLIDFGYEVSLNLASSDKFDQKTVDQVSKKFGQMNLKCIYLADTFGNLNEERTRDKIEAFKMSLLKNKSHVPIGFHPHDNMRNALSKSKIALTMGVKMLDSTVLGIGRGAGNLRGEFFALDTGLVKVKPLLRFAEFFTSRHKRLSFQKTEILYALLSHFNIHPNNIELAKKDSLEDAYERFKEICQ